MRRTALLAMTALSVAATPLAASAQGYYPPTSQGAYQNGYPAPYSGQASTYPQSSYPPASAQQSGDYPAYPQSSYPRSSYPASDDRQGYSSPSYNQPSYNQPSYGQPSYGQPSYQQPSYSQPGYQQPYRDDSYRRSDDDRGAYVQPQTRTYEESNRAPTGGSLSSVFSCDASGNKQVGGAVIGGLVGALAGRALARGNRSLGTGIGAAVGAATGSYIGCKMQRDDVERATYATGQALTYSRAQTWSNPSTGASGTVNVYADNPRYAQYYGGRDCRIVDQNFTTRSGGAQTERFRACRDGSDWSYTRL